MTHAKWTAQAEHDIRAAEALEAAGHHEWACFTALQAAEKAEKAYFYALGMEPPLQRGREGHDLVKLSDGWPSSVRAAIPTLAEAQTRLNQHAENTRYPHHRGRGSAGTEYLAPHEDYGPADSRQAIEDARGIVGVCLKLAEEAKRFADGLGPVLAVGI